jgi:hypothetical protein
VVQHDQTIGLHHEQPTAEIGDWVDVMMFDRHL